MVRVPLTAAPLPSRVDAPLNFRPLLKMLTIVDKNGVQRPLDPNWAQTDLIGKVEDSWREKRPARLIVLKARQLGISTITEGMLFGLAVRFSDIHAIVAAQDLEATRHLFDMTRRYYDFFPLKKEFPTRYASQNRLQFRENRSLVQVMTASKSAGARGKTITALHGSEVAFWKHPELTWLALRQAVPSRPGTLIVMESTANGIGNFFHRQWEAAVSGESEFTPCFYPWFKHYEYLPCQGDECGDGTCRACVEEGSKVGRPTEAERELERLGCSPAHLAWRRWAIANLTTSEDAFKQEYPSTPEEAFLAAGVNVFPVDDLRAVYEPMPYETGRLEPNPRAVGGVEFIAGQGELRLYKRPSPQGEYFVSADPCLDLGGDEGDFAAMQVINRRTKEQVAVWEGRIDPYALADQCARLGAFYNMATVCPEVELSGQAMVGRLSAIYPHIWKQVWPDRPMEMRQSKVLLGWSTNSRRKAWLIGETTHWLRQKDFVLHDERTFEQMRGYVAYGPRDYPQFGPADDGHDDLVMAWMIAVICERTEAPLPRHQPETMPQARFGGDGVIWGVNDEEQDQWS